VGTALAVMSGACAIQIGVAKIAHLVTLTIMVLRALLVRKKKERGGGQEGGKRKGRREFCDWQL
jgi:hypothetical protein